MAFTIDTLLFPETIAAMKSATEDTKQVQVELDKAMNDLLASWEGTGAKRFQTVYNQIRQNLKDRSIALIMLSDYLQNKKDAYESADASGSDSLTSFVSRVRTNKH